MTKYTEFSNQLVEEWYDFYIVQIKTKHTLHSFTCTYKLLNGKIYYSKSK